MRFLINLGVTAVVSAFAWLLTASLAWCYCTSTPMAFPYVDQWIAALQWWGANWWCNVVIVGAAIMAGIITVGVSTLAWMVLSWGGKKGSRKASNPLYGQTGWASPAEMGKAGVKLNSKPF